MKLDTEKLYRQRDGRVTGLKEGPPGIFTSLVSKFCFVQSEIGADGVAYVFDATRQRPEDLIREVEE